MKLVKFKAQNCFGFRDAGELQLSYKNNFYYILGRNSSGKTALLTALQHLDQDKIPSAHRNFENFSAAKGKRYLRATFRRRKAGVDSQQLTRALEAKLAVLGLKNINPQELQATTSDRIINGVNDIYEEFLQQLRKASSIDVYRYPNGEYDIVPEDSPPEKARQRRQDIARLLAQTAPRTYPKTSLSNKRVQVKWRNPWNRAVDRSHRMHSLRKC